MPKRSGKPKSKDVNELAAAVVAEVQKAAEEPKRKKNPAAVALGRKGGLKGGKARMEALTPEERVALARKAARKRWGHEDEEVSEPTD